MSPVQRPLSGSPLSFDLGQEVRALRAQLADGSRSARTLVKNGPLRATLIGLAPGGSLASHSADGPITAHVLDGAIEFEAEGTTWPLAAGTLFSLDAGVAHAVRAPQGGIFLLTVAAHPAE